MRFRYTGQQYLGELNLNYYKARFYSPALGRFLQTDPIGTADDLNLYAYVGNDPVNFGDPTGLVKAEADRLGAAVGGSAAAQMLVPGQVAWNNLLSNFSAGNYGTAAVNGVTYVGDVALFALTLGGSQAYMAPARAALPAVESVAAKGAAETTRVGRWMSATEFKTMNETGRVVEGAGGRTYVVNPANPAAFTGAGRGSSIYAEFDVPTSVLKPGSKPEWSVIPGPNVTTRLYGPAPAELAPATCIVCVIGKP